MIAPPTTLDRAVVVAQPTKRTHRSCEDGTREHEGNRHAERVDTEEERSFTDGARGGREDEDPCENGADTRRGADGERAAEQNT